MNFTSVEIHLFANYTSASSFIPCLHTQTTLVSGGWFIVYTVTVGKLTFFKSVALHKSTTKIKDVCESVSFSLKKVFSCSHFGVRYPAISFAFFCIKKQKQKQKQTGTQKSLMFW